MGPEGLRIIFVVCHVGGVQAYRPSVSSAVGRRSTMVVSTVQRGSRYCRILARHCGYNIYFLTIPQREILLTQISDISREEGNESFIFLVTSLRLPIHPLSQEGYGGNSSRVLRRCARKHGSEGCYMQRPQRCHK